MNDIPYSFFGYRPEVLMPRDGDEVVFWEYEDQGGRLDRGIYNDYSFRSHQAWMGMTISAYDVAHWCHWTHFANNISMVRIFESAARNSIEGGRPTKPNWWIKK